MVKHTLAQLLKVDIQSDIAVYIQIENQIRYAIASGNLNPMEQLPSVRELSESLSINANTIAKSYRDLEVMGLLFTQRGIGVFVSKGADKRCKSECRQLLFEKVFQYAIEAKFSGMTKTETLLVIKKSMLNDGNMYSEAPRAILALAKDSKSRKSKS